MTKDVYSLFDCEKISADYYFFHIPKTAGTSLNAVLESVFAKDTICPPHLWHEILKHQKCELDKFRLYRGHFYTMLNCVIDKPLRGFVFLRQPVERALSHYGHVLRHKDHYLHAHAKKLGTLEAYLRDPLTSETVRNFQARSLVRKFDPIEMATQMSESALIALNLEKQIETTPIEISDEELLDKAKKALDKFCCIGITERFSESVKLLSYNFGWNFCNLPAALNTNSARPTVSRIRKEDLELLKSLNAVDLQLYEYALLKFEDELRQCGLVNHVPSGTFISHSQNFEDVMLWRALKHVQRGFYIDAGAWSPDRDSVTKAFYERCWSGINIEPNPDFYEQLLLRRPRDINLQIAIGDAEGTQVMNFLENPGLSTLDDAIAERHRKSGWSANRQEVQIRTLSAIWSEYVPDEQEVHFLKIDVEGFEEAALRGNDWSRSRPWVVVVEATLPMSQQESHESWEPILLSENYLFAYADGLNRFYVSQEHADLLPAFKCPPNVFDNFKLQAHQDAETRSAQTELNSQQAEAKAQQAEARAQQAEARAQQAEARAQQAEARAQQAEAASNQALTQLQAVYASTSWKITTPLRWVRNQLNLFKQHGAKSRLKALIRKALPHLIAFLRQHPTLKRYAIATAYRLGIAERMRKVYQSAPYSAPVPTPSFETAPELPSLPPQARRIYTDLKNAIEVRKAKN